MIKGAVHQGDIMDLNMNAPNNRVKKYMKQKLMDLKGEITKSIRIVGLQYPLSASDRIAREKMNI